MRTMCALLDLNDIKYTLNDVNIFEQAVIAAKAATTNSQPGDPVGKIKVPILKKDQGQKQQLQMKLVENGQTILGDAPSLYRYVCRTQRKDVEGVEKQIEENFYPLKKMNADKRALIDNYLDYVELMVRRNSSRITKLVIQNMMLKNPESMYDSEYLDDLEVQRDIDDEKNVFFYLLLGNLERQI